MSPEDAKKLYLSSDSPQDKVLNTYTGSFTAAARFAAFSPRRTSDPHTHTVGDWGLIRGAYSFDGGTWYPFGVDIANTSGVVPTFQTVEVNAYCGESEFAVQASNWTASSETIYWALEIMARD